jgi:hypothetical protein
VGASTVKWMTPDPCLVFNESYSKLYIKFEFCKEKNHRHSINILVYKAKQIMTTILFFLEDGASGVQVVDIEQTTV